ncbi:MAG: LemA family protein [Saprospiraceae bacterium]|nr:LemA family protein [Saprospiraceae bacterium]
MRPLITALILIAFGLIVFVSGCSTYNGFVDTQEDVENAWGKVQSAYQRRSDLIPNLVNTVKGYANFEQETLTKVIEARAKATSININPANATPEQLKAFQDAQAGVSQSLGRLLVTVEQYPELKANQNFLELQAQLEGTENRIKVERDNYNNVVTNYNKKVRRFPGNLYAGIFGFSQKAQFQAEEGAQNAPEVNFE